MSAPVAAAERTSHASRSAADAVQAKLTVGRSNDGYEQEADRVAGDVVSRNAAPVAAGGGGGVAVASRAAPRISRLKDQAVRRKGDEEEPQARVQRAEEEEAQPRIQRAEEEEAQPRIQRAEEEEAQAKIQRAEEEEAQARVQSRAEPRPEPRANVRDKRMYPNLGRVEKKLFESKRGGEPLADETRVSMETGFGADFGDVRVHTGADAIGLSRDLGAQAFTHGKDVYFNSGKYEPDTVRGRELLAHELTHVVQQGAAEQAGTGLRPTRRIAKPPERKL